MYLLSFILVDVFLNRYTKDSKVAGRAERLKKVKS